MDKTYCYYVYAKIKIIREHETRTEHVGLVIPTHPVSWAMSINKHENKGKTKVTVLPLFFHQITEESIYRQAMDKHDFYMIDGLILGLDITD